MMARTNLQKIMFEKEVSLKALSIDTGISYTHLSKIVNGHHNPSIDNAYAIADSLNLHINRVFPNLHRYDRLKRKRTR